MATTITLDLSILNRAYQLWEIDHRDGKCMTDDQVKEMTIKEHGDKSSAALLKYVAQAEAEAAEGASTEKQAA